jgi:cell division septation protein DedD
MRNVGSATAGIILAVIVIGCAAPNEAGDATATGSGELSRTAGAKQAAKIQQAPVSPSPPPHQPLKTKDAQQVLNDAYAAFERKQYDAAMSGAQRVLVGNAQGPGAAEAHYLRGRVFEERATQADEAGNKPAAKTALQSARDAYNAALTAKPTPAAEGRIRAGIANVAYFQEDYATAIAAGNTAYEKTSEPQIKAWVLYRVGLSEQRFGNFAEADRIFAAVQRQYPNTEPARRAAAHQGVRGFHVQVGAYASPANADNVLGNLRADGVIGMRLTDAGGRNVVRVGPAATYEQAKALKAKLAAKYPDAVIIP